MQLEHLYFRESFTQTWQAPCCSKASWTSGSVIHSPPGPEEDGPFKIPPPGAIQEIDEDQMS